MANGKELLAHPFYQHKKSQSLKVVVFSLLMWGCSRYKQTERVNSGGNPDICHPQDGRSQVSCELLSLGGVGVPPSEFVSRRSHQNSGQQAGCMFT